jgi:hypothetical protein
MIQEGLKLASLICEYEEVLLKFAKSEGPLSGKNLKLLSESLCRCADWSEEGAGEIIRLSKDYGAFMLRNALAVAIVIGQEDGELGF